MLAWVTKKASSVHASGGLVPEKHENQMTAVAGQVMVKLIAERDCQ